MSDKTKFWWSLLLADHLDPTTSEQEIERGIAGVALMPWQALLVGAGPTRQDVRFDLQALLRTTAGLERAFAFDLELYLDTSEDHYLARATRRATRLGTDIRSRMLWHAAHEGFEEHAARLLAEVHLRGTAAQRAYVGALVQRVDRLGTEARWSTSIDHELLREGLRLIMPRAAVDHASTSDLHETLRDAGPTDPTWAEIERVGTTHPMTIPLSPREIAVLDHLTMNRKGMWDLLREGEYDHLSDDWKLEGRPAWQHAPADAMKGKAEEPATAVDVPATQDEIDEPDKPDPLAPVQDDSGVVTVAVPKKKKKAKDPRPRHWVVDVPRDAEAARMVSTISGQSLPLCVAPLDIVESRRHLADRFPHATDIVDELLGDMRAGDAVGFRPTLVVGDPGSGKTSLLNEIVQHLQLYVTLYPCASVSDGSFGGTPMQWATRRVSTPLQAIVRAGVANPVVLLDELEKAGMSERNGALQHALLPMLEAHTATAYFETAIETPADLSQVSYLATANSLEGVPDPLRDRFRILRMPNPRLEHAEAIAQAVVRGERDARLLRFEEHPDFAPDEIALIKRAWGGGSLRRLNRVIDASLRAREAYLRSRPQ